MCRLIPARHSSPSNPIGYGRRLLTESVDLNSEYPCPCRRRGHLLPITLTEAFGCERCQQIFVVEDNGQVIKQLSSIYPYKRTWRWTGYKWRKVHPVIRKKFFPLTLGIILILLIIGLQLTLRSLPSLSMIFWIIVAVLVTFLSALMILLAYQR